MPTIPQTSPQVRTPPQGNPIGILAVSHNRGGSVRNATAQGRNQGGSAAASPYGSALCHTYSTRNLNTDAADEEADLVSRLRDGAKPTYDDTVAGPGNSPGGDDKDDSMGAKGAAGEPESKKRKVVAPYRQGCVGTLLYSTQKAKLLTELPLGTTLILQSGRRGKQQTTKLESTLLIIILQIFMVGYGSLQTVLSNGEQRLIVGMCRNQTTTHTTWGSTRNRMVSIW